MSNTIYIVYQTTNLVNNKYYIGYHEQIGTDFDGYFGSGDALRAAIKKYGSENFIRKTLSTHQSSNEAFVAEESAIGNKWNTDPLCYNKCPGGSGGNKTTLTEHDRLLHIQKMRQIHANRSSEQQEAINKKLSAIHKNRSSEEQQRIWNKQQETRRKLYPKDKENNPMFKGHYQTPWGIFSTSFDAVNTLSFNMNFQVLIKWCKNNDTIITQRMINRNTYLTQEMLGMTFKDLGFDFIPKES